MYILYHFFISIKLTFHKILVCYVKGQCVFASTVVVDSIPNDPMLLFLDNSDSPSIVEQ